MDILAILKVLEIVPNALPLMWHGKLFNIINNLLTQLSPFHLFDDNYHLPVILICFQAVNEICDICLSINGFAQAGRWRRWVRRDESLDTKRRNTLLRFVRKKEKKNPKMRFIESTWSMTWDYHLQSLNIFLQASFISSIQCSQNSRHFLYIIQQNIHFLLLFEINSNKNNPTKPATYVTARWWVYFNRYYYLAGSKMEGKVLWWFRWSLFRHFLNAANRTEGNRMTWIGQKKKGGCHCRRKELPQ